MHGVPPSSRRQVRYRSARPDTTNPERPFGSSAVVGPSWRRRQSRRRGGGEDPWLCGPGFRRVCLCRGMLCTELRSGTGAVNKASCAKELRRNRTKSQCSPVPRVPTPCSRPGLPRSAAARVRGCRAPRPIQVPPPRRSFAVAELFVGQRAAGRLVPELETLAIFMRRPSPRPRRSRPRPPPVAASRPASAPPRPADAGTRSPAAWRTAACRS